MDTHKIPRYRAFPKLKHPELNDIAKDIYNEYSEKKLMPILASSSYRDVPDNPEGGRIQKLRLLNILDLTKTQVYDEVINRVGRNLRDLQASSPEATEQIEKLEGQLEYMFKLQFSSFSGTIRRQAELSFKKKPTNWEDWQTLHRIGKRLRTNR